MAASVLLLDLDGTLVDTNAAHAESFVRATTEAGVSLPRDRFEREIGKGSDLIVRDVYGPSFERERGAALLDTLGRHFREIAKEQSFTVFEGAERVIRAARERGLRTAIATSSAEDNLVAIFESAGTDLRDRVDYVTSASDVNESKPAPDIVEAVAEHFGVPAASCVLVGDTIYDVLAARRAGAACVGVATWVWSEDDLRSHGARVTYASTAALADDLDGALAAASPGESALTDSAADALLREALSQARAALDAGDAPIGAVIGRADGTVVARGRNRAASTSDRLRHAETDALHALGDAVDAEDGLVLVTTLEPCAMCLGAATEAGIHAVLYPLEAPLNGAGGGLDGPPGRRLPLVSAWAGDGDRHRTASLDLLRLGADRSGDAFLRRLLASIDA